MHLQTSFVTHYHRTEWHGMKTYEELSEKITTHLGWSIQVGYA